MSLYKMQEIGKGLYGKVYRTKYNNVDIAVKHIKIKPNYCIQGVIEIDTLKHFDHPYIIKLIYISRTNDYSAILIGMELAEIDLYNHYIKNYKSLSEEEKVHYVYCLVSAISALRDNGLYHCDIKPQNCLMFPRADQSKFKYDLKISDFGISVYMIKYNLDCQSLILSPPEVMHQYWNKSFYPKYSHYGSQTLNFDKTVIFGTGMMIYYILTSSLPYKDDVEKVQAFIDNPAKMMGKVSDDWINIILPLVQPNTNLRVFDPELLIPPFLRYGYNDFEYGTVIRVGTSMPKLLNKFGYSVVATWFRSCIYQLNFHPFVLFATLDLFMRTADHVAGDDKFMYQGLMVVCFSLICSAMSHSYSFGEYFHMYNGFDEKEFIQRQYSIIVQVGGFILSYNNLYDTCSTLEELRSLCNNVIYYDSYNEELLKDKPAITSEALHKKIKEFRTLILSDLITL